MSEEEDSKSLVEEESTDPQEAEAESEERTPEKKEEEEEEEEVDEEPDAKEDAKKGKESKPAKKKKKAPAKADGKADGKEKKTPRARDPATFSHAQAAWTKDVSTAIAKNAQSVEVDSSKDDKSGAKGTKPRRSAIISNTLVEYLYEDAKTIYEIFFRTAVANPKTRGRNFLGKVGKLTKKGLPIYVWERYSQVFDLCQAFASGLVELGLEPGMKVGLYGKNTREWVIAEQACHFQSLVSVALYDTFGEDNLQYVINHSEMQALVTSREKLPTLFKIADKCPNLKYIIQMENPDPETKDEIATAQAELGSIKLLTLAQVGKSGREANNPNSPPSPEDLATIMYTSGTTGRPKGVMLSQKNIVSAVTSGYTVAGGMFPKDRYISYLPLAHIIERAMVLALMLGGGSIGFYRGDVKKLVEDIQALKPTLLAGVPRVWERIYARLQARVKTLSASKQKIFRKGFEKKKKTGRGGLYDLFVFKKMAKKALGGATRVILSGGAPLTARTQEFLRICFCCPVIQGYGLTETAGMGTIQNVFDIHGGRVGPPQPCAEVRLVDCPELNYTSGDEPHARGEIWIRGPSVSSGYYKNPEKTAEEFDEDGWFHSGDIGRWNGDGTLSVIDRKKNIFKLAQGEYVATEFLEGIYSTSPFVGQIWITAESTWNFLVAVIVPEVTATIAWGKKNKKEWAVNDKEEQVLLAAAKDEEFSIAVSNSLHFITNTKKLKGFERIFGILLYGEELTPDSGLLTPTMKFKRPALREHFGELLTKLHADIDSNGIRGDKTFGSKGDKGKTETPEETKETKEKTDDDAEEDSAEDESPKAEEKEEKEEESAEEESAEEASAEPAAAEDSPDEEESSEA